MEAFRAIAILPAARYFEESFTAGGPLGPTVDFGSEGLWKSAPGSSFEGKHVQSTVSGYIMFIVNISQY